MRFTRVFIVLLAVLSLSACKIIIRVGNGGIVTYSTGSCAAGQTCEISVTDFMFSDTFTAVPDDDFDFAGWRKRDRGLCGGSTRPCELSTRDLPRVNAVRALLNTDDESFFLVAQFERKPDSGGGSGGGGGSASGSAMACYNPELLQQGTQAEFIYRVRDPEVGSFITDFEVMVMGTEGFNGQEAIEVQTRLQEVVDGTLADATVLAYSTFDESTKESRNYGSKTTATADGMSIDITVTNDPYELFSFALNPGESFTHTYTSTVSTDIPDLPMLPGVPGLGDQVLNNSDRVTYVGRERVTVDAGTFETCKFEIRTTSSLPFGSTSTTTTLWYIVGLGVIVKEESDDTGLELQSGSTLNGSPIR